jgi:hypothetical protein
MKNPTSIKERIQQAASVEEVNTLLAKLKHFDFDFASAKTVAACHNAAKRRVKQLRA